jgi:2,3,4,5-tetrahydropyridine-2-carboxylate N-succinyltransferase
VTRTTLEQQVRTMVATSGDQAAQDRETVDALLNALESGEVRAAEPQDRGWKVNSWVKEGILHGFRIGRNVSFEGNGLFRFRDRDTFPTWDPSSCGRNVRIVPGGTTVRRGAYVADGVVIMPPAYVNVGAWVGEGTMIDSHALVGSCAQVGAGVHLSAAAQVGGVLEPVGALPVIVEDDVFVGGNCGIYEGARIGKRAVLASGVVITRAVPIHDLVRETVYRADQDGVISIPAGAVVVPGTRPTKGEYASRLGIHLQAPVIVKYRDKGTDASSTLEEALR